MVHVVVWVDPGQVQMLRVEKNTVLPYHWIHDPSLEGPTAWFRNAKLDRVISIFQQDGNGLYKKLDIGESILAN